MNCLLVVVVVVAVLLFRTHFRKMIKKYSDRWAR